MDIQDVVRMARSVWGESAILPFDDLEKFANLVAQQQVEECAKLFDKYEQGWISADAVQLVIRNKQPENTDGFI